MSQRQVIEQIATHLAAQRGQARGADGGCAYRGENNSMCAVGCLIPDEHYRSNIEGCAFHTASVAASLDEAYLGPLTNTIAFLETLTPEMSKCHMIEFFCSVQNFHDQAYEESEGPDAPAGEVYYEDLLERSLSDSELKAAIVDQLELRAKRIARYFAEESVNSAVSPG